MTFEERVEKAARAMRPNHFTIYDAGFTAANWIDQQRFLSAEKEVKRARKHAAAGIRAAFPDLYGEKPTHEIAEIDPAFRQSEGCCLGLSPSECANVPARHCDQSG